MVDRRKLKHLYIPIEIKVREFDAKLLLALIAAEYGFRVIIGSQKDLRQRVAWWPAGIYLDKSVADTKLKWFRYFRRLGHTLVAWDEEGLIIHPDTYLNRRFSPESFALLEGFFTWGDFQTKLIESKYAKDKQKLLVAGNPRMDMLRPEMRMFHTEESSRITQQYGRLLLINTNFNFYNHIVSREAGKNSFLKNHPEMSEEFIENWIDYQRKIFESFVELLPDLQSSFPDHSIIIRPHPAENHTTWSDLVKCYENVHVVHRNNVSEWILAADVVIHSNCTTGVESFLLGTPCIAYRPIISQDFDTSLPNLLSNCASNSQEIIALIREVLGGGVAQTHSEEKLQEAALHIAAIEGNLSCEKVVDYLMKLQINESSFELKYYEKISRSFINFIPILKKTFNNIKENWQPFARPNFGSSEKFKDSSVSEVKKLIHQQTIPDICIDEIMLDLEKFRFCLNRFNSIKINDLGSNCFEITNC